MKKAPYLKIQNKRINIDEVYWTVSGLPPFSLESHVAKNENNVIKTCYFFTEIEAEQYQKMCELGSILNQQIMDIEKRNCYYLEVYKFN